MKFLKFKRLAAAALAVTMVFSLAACGTPGEPEKKDEEAAKTEAPAEGGGASAAADAEKPAAVTDEDWAAMKKEPVFGTELNYLFNGGACVSAKYMAEVQGYYKEYGINASYLEGESVVNTVGTGQCLWGTDHIATMLVPVTNGVNMTFVAGAHIGCKSIFVPADSAIKTVEDLKGKNVDEVKAVLEKMYNLLVIIKKEEAGVDAVANTIVKSEPEAGARLTEGQQIILYVPDMTTVYPDFTKGKYTLKEIEAWCEKYGVELLPIYQETDEYKVGTIYDQSQKAGTPVVKNSSLTIYIADEYVDDTGQDLDIDPGE